jgi:hypothetical protein
LPAAVPGEVVDDVVLAVSTALLHLLRASPEQTDWCHENSPPPPSLARSAFAGFCFPPEVIVLSVRW